MGIRLFITHCRQDKAILANCKVGHVMYSVYFGFFGSEGMSAGKNCADDGCRGERPLSEVQRNLPQSAHPTRTGGPPKDLW